MQSHRCPKVWLSLVPLAFLLVLVVRPDLGNAAERPNILLIMADDLGYSDLGCYGGEIRTPHLDRLAQHGVRFSQFYNTGRCWPTRAALLTGYYAQSVRRDKLFGIASKVPSGNRGVRPSWAPLISEPLKAAGYRTYHTGKWHLDGMPLASGFDRSYYLRDQHRFFNPTLHWLDDRKLPPVEKDSGFYATVALGDHAVECLRDHANDHADKPFFHYLAFTAPHFPLQALPADIDRYRDRYTDGWEKIRQTRWQRQQSFDVLPRTLSDVMRDLGPPYDFPDAIKQLGPGEVNRPLVWNSLTPVQKSFQATKMAIHAAMIDCMDQQIGRVLNQLRDMGAMENTMILFLSDNGASAEIMVRGDGHDPSAPMGSWATHLCLGPGWSTVSNTPFRYHKTWTHEGGIATPLIIHWPAKLTQQGEWNDQAAHVIDLWPTIMELAGIDESQKFDRPGQSLLPALLDDQRSDRLLWWSHESNRALRDGNWKISVAGADAKWELYRLDRDRAETNDLADQYPDKLAEMIAKWNQLNQQHAEMATSD